MKKLRYFLTAFLLTVAGVGAAATFNLFQPATGILKGNSSTYVTTAAASTDVISLWSGTCNASSFLRGDGSCQTVSSVSPANPTATIGLTAVNGSAGTFLRSDGAPALSQAIAPTWTGAHLFTNASFELENALPRVRLDESDQAADGRIYGVATNAGIFEIAALNDALNVKTQFLTAARTSGTTDITSVSLLTGASPGTPRLSLNSSGALSLSGSFGTSGQVLQTNGNASPPTWVTPSATGVTSVGLTMPSGFSVGGSPVTSTGTLAVTTTLNGVLAGNGSGFTTASAANVYGLWSGTCNSGTFLRGDGTCAAPAGGSAQGAAAYPSGSQSMVANDAVVINLGAELFDTGNYHDNTTNNARVILPSGSGYASCSGQITFLMGNTSANPGGPQNYRFNAYLVKNNTTGSNGEVLASQTIYFIKPTGGSAGTGDFLQFSVSNAMIPANGTDYVTMVLYQTGTMDTGGSIPASSFNTASSTRLTCTQA